LASFQTHPNVFSVVNPQGHRSDSLSQAAAFIYQYWFDFWQNHHALPEAQILAQLRQGLPAIHPTEFPDLEIEHIISIFRSNVDPLALTIYLFVNLAQRWALAGRAPAQMHQARMATSPKPGKFENGSVSVHTRPISRS